MSGMARPNAEDVVDSDKWSECRTSPPMYRYNWDRNRMDAATDAITVIRPPVAVVVRVPSMGFAKASNDRRTGMLLFEFLVAMNHMDRL